MLSRYDCIQQVTGKLRVFMHFFQISVKDEALEGVKSLLRVYQACLKVIHETLEKELADNKHVLYLTKMFHQPSGNQVKEQDPS